MNLERLKNLREDNDYKQEYIGAVLNIHQRTYSRYERGERTIPLELLSKLADFYGTSVDYLMGRTNIKKPYPKPLSK